MKLGKLLSYTFFSMLLSSQIVSADWENTPSIAINQQFTTLFNQVVIDNQGNATTLWEEIDSASEPPKGRIAAAVLKAEGTKWQLTNTIPNYPTQSITGPASTSSRQAVTLVLSNEGIAACAFTYTLDNYNGHSYIVSTFLNSETKKWETPKTISDITNFGDSRSGNVSMAYDKNSRLYAVWSDSSTEKTRINFSQLGANESTWSKPITISTGPTTNLSNSVPILAINPHQGRIVTIWLSTKNNEDSNRQLYGAYFSIETGQWSVPELLTTPGFFLGSNQYQISQVTIGSDNYAVVGYVEDNGDETTKAIKYAILDSNEKWTSHLTLMKKSYLSRDVSIAIDGDFQTTFLFDAIENDSSKIYSSVIPFKGSPSNPQQISISGSISPKVIIDPIGKSIAIWTTTLANGNNSVFSAELPKGGKWTKPIKISNENRNQNANNSLGLAVNILGTNIAVWSDQTLATNTDIINGAIKVNNLPLPPTCIKGKQGKNKFLLQQERVRFNKIKWCTSPSANVVSYNLYRTGKLIKNVKADQSLEYVDKNIEKDATTVYAVRAVNKAGKISQAIYLTLP